MKKIRYGIIASVLFTGMACAGGPEVAPMLSWTAFYVGANGGYGWGNPSVNFYPLPNPVRFVNLRPATLNPDLTGGTAGGQLGFDWQAGSWLVLGLKFDMDWSGLTGSAVRSPIVQNSGVNFNGGSLSASTNLNWFGNLLGRIGFLPIEELMIYGTGGLAFGNVAENTVTDFTPHGTARYPGSLNRDLVGWAAGAGVEWLMMSHLSVGAEYLYNSLENDSVVANPIRPNPPFQMQYNYQLTYQTVELFVNYRFNF